MSDTVKTDEVVKQSTGIHGWLRWSLKLAYNVLFKANYSVYVCGILLLCELILLNLIIVKVPYTEIDYSTYMQQIEQIERGELDYSKIRGSTGPIVYPGGYVFIYSWMKKITCGMDDVNAGQHVFKYLYLVSLGMSFFILLLVQGENRVKPFVFILMTLSKRLHSIYVLRLFNDCFTTYFMLGTIILLQIAAKLKRKSYESKSNDYGLYSGLIALLAVDCYAIGVSIKMNGLLYLPGLIVILYYLNDENAIKLVGMLLFGVMNSIGMNLPFLTNGKKVRDAFLSNAFDFKRQFMYKWSVNWKMIDEETFLDKKFHLMLLILHMCTLLWLVLRVWMSREMSGKSLWKTIVVDGLGRFYRNTISRENKLILGPDAEFNVLKVMAMSNIVGVLFARSLHYQFLSWYAHTLPFLVFDSIKMQSKGSGVIGSALGTCVVVILHEWAWNVYPSTAASSIVIVVVLACVVASQSGLYSRSMDRPKTKAE